MSIKAKIEALKEKVKDDADMLSIVHDLVENSHRYITAVVNMENSITTMRFRLDGEDYRQYMQNLDTARRIVHNALISSVKIVNRLCNEEKIELIYEGDITDRFKVGSLAMEIVDDYFKNRIP